MLKFGLLVSAVSVVSKHLLIVSADKQVNDGANNDYTAGRLAANYGIPSAAPTGYTIQHSADNIFDVDCMTSGGQAGCTGERILFEGAALTTGKDTLTYDTNFAACKAACEAWNTCTGFVYVYNPGMYDTTAKVNRCVGKAGYPTVGPPAGQLVTSRFGMAFYSRDLGAVTGQTDGTTTNEDIANAIGAAAGMATGLLIAVIVIPIVAIVLLIVCIVCCCKSCNKNKQQAASA